MRYYVFDLETLFNFFSFTGKFEGEEEVYAFEISTRKNDRNALITHLNFLREQDVMMVGYNSLGFDYPILHEFIMQPYTFDHNTAYRLCQEIINTQNYGFNKKSVRQKDRAIRQLDLVKINHFDNANKRTRLKDLEFAMKMDSIEDMPVKLGVPITHEEMDKVLQYNKHDVVATEKFLGHCKPLIDVRLDILETGALYGDVLNYSDVKLGTEFLIKKIGKTNCFEGREPKQSMRHMINVKDIILPKINFRTEQYQAVLDWYKDQAINMGTKERPKLKATLAGIDFHFGVGGVHASVNNKVYKNSETHVIKDIDVTGMYVSVAIANRFAPEHLGEAFVKSYTQVKQDRAQYAKGTTMNAVLKLAGNGVYGNSNNPYSCFYDPKYTFTVTINGQLQLLQLVERLDLIPGLEIIQANTDGITVYMPRDVEPWFNLWCRDWESQSGLALEEVDYDGMWIADVNAYIARTTDGKVKRKGRYWYPENWKEYEGWWNKDFSNLAARKMAEQVMLHGANVDSLIAASSDPFDFMLRYKTPKTATVYMGETPQQGTTRYYVSASGETMIKKATPKGEIGQFKRANKLTDSYFEKVMTEIGKDIWDSRIHTKNKSKYQIVTTSIQSGWKVKECNKADKFDWSDVDFNYYKQEVDKLLIGGNNG